MRARLFSPAFRRHSPRSLTTHIPKEDHPMKTMTPLAFKIEPIVSAVPDAPKYDLERDLESVIMAAAAGSILAKRMLRPVVYAIALDALTYADAAERVTRYTLSKVGSRRGQVGAPRPGRAAYWLENIVRVFATREIDDTNLEKWETWDPPHPLEEEGTKPAPPEE